MSARLHRAPVARDPGLSAYLDAATGTAELLTAGGVARPGVSEHALLAAAAAEVAAWARLGQPATDAAPPPPAAPTMRLLPARPPRTCAAGCGQPVSRPGRRCQACGARAVWARQPARRRSPDVCALGCGRAVSRAGGRCSSCAAKARWARRGA